VTLLKAKDMARRSLTRKCIKGFIQNAEPAPTKVEGFQKKRQGVVRRFLKVGRQSVPLIAVVYLPARTRFGCRRRIKRNAQLAWLEAVLTAEVLEKGGTRGDKKVQTRRGVRIDKRYQYHFPPKTDKV
jgi:hypothetical protein